MLDGKFYRRYLFFQYVTITISIYFFKRNTNVETSGKTWKKQNPNPMKLLDDLYMYNKLERNMYKVDG